MAASTRPPLPPRMTIPAGNANLSPVVTNNPPPYSVGFNDPRSSSTQSLEPVESAGDARRTLLLVYIHGFLGTETSFKSFPAHVHNLLSPALAQTHVVYTKIYPRYKSRKNVSFARDDFSRWLAPRESNQTDIILVGHSLGGILAAEVILFPAQEGTDNLFQHRILGLIAFDTPFLGMHPGVIGTGISSLFRAPPQLPISPPPDPELLPENAPEGFTFNPSYTNDLRMTDRSGKVNRFWYFWNKHCGELMKATGQYVTSHLEFGGCLADYPGLKRRYAAMRALEDVEEIRGQRAPDGKLMQRVRLVNYYSASSGIIKEHSPSTTPQELLAPPDAEFQDVSSRRSSLESLAPTAMSSPQLSLEEHRDGELVTKDISELNIDPGPPELTPATTNTESAHALGTVDSSSAVDPSSELGLPPLPQLPDRPLDFSADEHDDPDMVKLLRKEHERRVKAYERAVKDRNDTIKDREKLLAKRKKALAKAQGKISNVTSIPQGQTSGVRREQSLIVGADNSMSPLQHESRSNERTKSASKRQKDRKFCALPPKDAKTGKDDRTWIRRYFEGIDEVTAHTAMFDMSEGYVKMVNDVVERIETWIAEDASTRMILADNERLD